MALTEITKVTGPGIHTLSNILSHNINSSGIITATKFVGPIESGSATFTGNVSIGGTLTYEDVTNIDSVGVITARNGIFIPDNNKLELGNAAGSGDLRLYHDTNNSYIQDLGTGQLRFLSNDYVFYNAAGNENLLRVTENTGVNLYDGTNTIRLSTNDTGVDINGHTNLDNVSIAGVSTFSNNVHLLDNDEIQVGGSAGTFDGMKLYHNGSHSYIDETGTGGLIIKSNHFIGNAAAYSFMNAANSHTVIYGAENGAVNLYYSGSKKFETTHMGGILSGILTTTSLEGAGGNLPITSGGFELFRFTSTGRFGIGTNNPTGMLHIYGVNPPFRIQNSNDTANLQMGMWDGSHIMLQASNRTFKFATETSNDILFNTGGLAGSYERLRITSGGTVNIGGNYSHTGSKFQVTGNSTFTGNIDANGDLDVDGHTNLDNVNIAGVTTTGNLYADNLYAQSSLTINNNSNVSVNLTSTSTTGSSRIFFGDPDSALVGRLTYSHDGDYMQFFTAYGERLRINSSGHIGMGGNINPTNVLHIKTAVTNTAVATIESTATNSYPFLRLKNDAREYQLTCHGGLSDSFTIYDGTSSSHRFTISADGFIGINDNVPYTGLTINKEGDYWDTNGNTYAHPVGRVLSTWRGDRNDDTDYWVGFVGKYLKPSATVNILLQPHVGNFNNQAGMYIAGEATGNFSSVLTIGKIISGNQAGRGTSGAQRATKSEIIRVNPNTKILHTRADNTTRYDVEFRNTGGISDGNYGGIHFTQGSSGATNLAAMQIAYNNSGRPDIVFHHRNRGGGNALQEALRITSDGIVGINQSEPGGSGLDITTSRSTTYSESSDQRSLANLVLRQTSDAPNRFVGLSFVNGGGTQAEASINLMQTGNYEGDLRFKFRAGGGSTDWRSRFRMTSGGMMGFNGNPNRYLHVYGINGGGNFGTAAFEQNHPTNSATVMFMSTLRNGSSSESFLQCNRDQDNNGQGVKAVAFIRTNGDFDSDTNSYGGISDIKLKENIVDAKSQWDDIKNIRVRNFNFKDNPSQKMLGVVAQEVETVSAGLVKDCPDENITSPGPEDTSTKSVKYSILYMKAIKALQEAQARIETLEAKVAALEGS